MKIYKKKDVSVLEIENKELEFIVGGIEELAKYSPYMSSKPLTVLRNMHKNITQYIKNNKISFLDLYQCHSSILKKDSGL